MAEQVASEIASVFLIQNTPNRTLRNHSGKRPNCVINKNVYSFFIKSYGLYNPTKRQKRYVRNNVTSKLNDIITYKNFYYFK